MSPSIKNSNAGATSQNLSLKSNHRPQSSYQMPLKTLNGGSLTKLKFDVSSNGWTDADEKFYRSYRSEMRERLANDSKTGPWE